MQGPHVDGDGGKDNLPLSPSSHDACYHDGAGKEAKHGLRLGPQSSREAHSALRCALSANIATRTSPEVVWVSFSC
eukprot:11731126-Alexandrium_andersonii.AAC.1